MSAAARDRHRLTEMGSHAVLFEAEGPLTLATQQRIWKLALRASDEDGVLDVQAGMNNLLITFASPDFDPAALERRLGALWAGIEPGWTEGKLLEIGVVYGGEAGEDLAAVARACGLSVAEVVRLHAAAEYTVFAPGVAPSFGYLHGLDPRLSLPRRATPEPRQRNATILIAGGQCSIGRPRKDGQPKQITGWHAIGCAPEAPLPFDPARRPPGLVAPGDRIRFRVEEIVT